MLHLIAGGEDKWRERPFVSQSNCFVVPPMKFAFDACKCMEVAVRGGMPVLLLLAGQVGATAPASLASALVQEVAECLASLMGFSLESLLIDNDIIGAPVQRTIRGIEVDDESISLDTMRKVCLEGPGHYLGSDQTLKLMQKDYLYPTVGDRSSPNQWLEAGKPSIVDRASRKVETILATHYPTHIPTAVDDAIRAKFPVRLAREAMRPPV